VLVKCGFVSIRQENPCIKPEPEPVNVLFGRTSPAYAAHANQPSNLFLLRISKLLPMGLKFNFGRIPVHWRLLIGLQLGISGLVMAYRQRVLTAKAKRDDA